MDPRHPERGDQHLQLGHPRIDGRARLGGGEGADLFYAGLVVGLVITQNGVRSDAIRLGKDIIGTIV